MLKFWLSYCRPKSLIFVQIKHLVRLLRAKRIIHVTVTTQGSEIFTWAWAIPVMAGVKTITVAFRLTETITVSVFYSTSTSTAPRSFFDPPSLYNVVTRHLQRRGTPMVTMSTGHTYTQQKQGDSLKIFVSLHSQDRLLKLTLRCAFILTVVSIANCIITMTKCNINCRRGE